MHADTAIVADNRRFNNSMMDTRNKCAAWVWVMSAGTQKVDWQSVFLRAVQQVMNGSHSTIHAADRTRLDADLASCLVNHSAG